MIFVESPNQMPPAPWFEELLSAQDGDSLGPDRQTVIGLIGAEQPRLPEIPRMLPFQLSLVNEVLTSKYEAEGAAGCAKWLRTQHLSR